MSESLAFLPLLTVFAAAIGVFSLELLRKRDLAITVFFISMIALFLLGLRYFQTALVVPFVSQASGWQAPFGISFYIDALSAGMISISAFVVFFSVLCGSVLQPKAFEYQHSYSLILLLLVGVVGAYTTADIFNLYVWFEVFLTASFGILTFTSQIKNVSGIQKYIVLNIIGSAIFLVGLSLLYSSTGTLNMAGIARALQNQQVGPHFIFAAVSMIIAFMIKAGIAPVYGWLPFSYPQMPGAMTAVFSALLTKVGIFCLLRLEMMGVLSRFQNIGVVICIFTMFFGAMLALSQRNIFSLLSHNIIASIGFIALGVFIGTKAAISASIFYLFHHIVAKANLFLIESVREDSDQSQGQKRSWLSLAFIISAGALAGIPPFSGFWAKLYLLVSVVKWPNQSGLKWLTVISIVLVSVLILILMFRLWNLAFVNPNEPQEMKVLEKKERPQFMRALPALSIFALLTWTLIMSFGGDSISHYTMQMTEQLLNREGFIKLVLGTPMGGK